MADANVQLELELITKNFREQISAAQKAGRDFQITFDKTAKGIQSSFRTIDSSAKKTSTALDVLKGVIGANVIVGAFNTIRKAAVDSFGTVVNAAGNLEQVTTQFQTLTGSVDEAQKVIRELQEFTATTPFRFEGVAQAGRQLLSFGFQTQELVPLLRTLGDAASGSGTSINDLTLIFGQVAAAGKLTGERLLQLQERAIPIGPALAQTLGVAESAVRDLVSKGQVSFSQFREAFASLSDAGGPFFESTVRQSQTLNGVLSTLGDNFELVAQDIGGAFLPAIKEIAIVLIRAIQQNREFIRTFAEFAVDAFIQGFRSLTQAVQNATKFLQDNQRVIENVGISIGIATTAYAGYRAALAATIIIQNVLTAATTAFSLALKSVGIGIIIAALAGLVEVIRFAIEDFNAFSATIQEFAAGSIDAIIKLVDAAIVSGKEIGRVFGIEVPESVTKFRNSLAETSASLRASAAENRRLSEETKAQKLAEIESINATALAEVNANQLRVDSNAQRIEQQKLQNEEFRLLQEELKLAQQENESFERETQAQQDVIDQDVRLQQIQVQIGKEEALKLAAQKRAADNQKKAIEAEIAIEKSLTQAKQKEFLAREKNAIEAEKTRQANFRSSLDTIATLQSSGNKTFFRIGQAAAVATSIIDGIAAVQKALSAAPPPFNFALAALVGTATAVNTAKIASSKPPSFQSGGIVPGNSFSGDNVVANVNSGELILNRRQQANLFAAIDNGDVGGGGVTINVNGDILAEDSFIDRMAERLSEAAETRNVRLASSEVL